MSVWVYPVRRASDGRPVVVDVWDGDTFRLLLDCGVDVSASPKLRLAGVNCPELGVSGGAVARDFTAAHLAGAARITVTVHGRSFDRWVASIDVDGADLAQLLLDAGHATRWER